MRLSYDIEADALTVALADGVVAQSIEVEPGTIVDVDAENRVLTIEVVRRIRPWPLAGIFTRFDFSPRDRAMLMGIANGTPTIDVVPLAALPVA